MKIKDYPNLLIVNRLVRPIEISHTKLIQIREHLNPELDKVLMHGIFVLAVASTEVMLSDILKYLLSSIPQKLPEKEFKYDKETFFENYFDLLKKSTENYVKSLSYKSFENFSDKFIEHVGIDWPKFHNDIGKYIQEIKATRNLLLHNNLVINDQYKESAGELKRRNIVVDYQYVCSAVDLFIKYEDILKEKIINKYKSYTKIKANKELWSFLFNSPVMQFDDYWHYNEENDDIIGFKEGKHEGALSGSETAMLGLWRTHFHGSGGDHLKHFHIRKFDNIHREKVMLFLTIAYDFSFY